MTETNYGINPERAEHASYKVGDRVLVTDQFTANFSKFFWKGTVKEIHKEIHKPHSPRGSISVYYGIDYDQGQNVGRRPPRWVFQSGDTAVATIGRLDDI